MKAFLLSVLASIVAAAVFLAVPPLGQLITRQDVCLDVEVQTDSYAQLTIAKVSTRSLSDFSSKPTGFNPAKFWRILVK
jgi:hypothetical protein